MFSIRQARTFSMSKLASSAAHKARISGMHATRTSSCADEGVAESNRAAAGQIIKFLVIKIFPPRILKYYWHIACQNILAIGVDPRLCLATCKGRRYASGLLEPDRLG